MLGERGSGDTEQERQFGAPDFLAAPVEVAHQEEPDGMAEGLAGLGLHFQGALLGAVETRWTGKPGLTIYFS